MSKGERFDVLGVKVEVGDIILSAPNGGGGQIGRVEKISPSGRITIKYKATRDIYAFERGAPDITYTTTQTKRDEFGVPVLAPVTGPYRRYAYEQEEVERTRHDYTVVGTQDYWFKGQAAELCVLVLAKKGTKPFSEKLLDEVEQDFDEVFPVAE